MQLGHPAVLLFVETLFCGVYFSILVLSFNRLEHADSVQEFKAGIRKFVALEVCLEDYEQQLLLYACWMLFALPSLIDIYYSGNIAFKFFHFAITKLL